MGIDYGTKRVGIAVSDPLRIIASSLTTVKSNEVFEFLENYFKKENVDIIVVGDPSGQNKNPRMKKLSDDFCHGLRKKFPKKNIERMHEFYTSKMAFQAMIDGGLKKQERKNKATVDKVSASIILQDYLKKIQC